MPFAMYRVFTGLLAQTGGDRGSHLCIGGYSSGRLEKFNCGGALAYACQRSGREDREQRPFPHHRSYFDPVAKYIDRTADDREPDAQAVAAFGRKTREGFEDSSQLIFRDPDTRVVYIDPYFGPFAAAADQNAPSGLRVSCGVGQQILEDAIEQHRIAHYMGIRWN